MMWVEIKQEIYTTLQPGHRGILKCRGEDRRAIKCNNGKIISLQTGKTSYKSITYEMIRYAVNNLYTYGEFNSVIYRNAYPSDYKNATCRYSMIGGILIEVEIAERIYYGNNSCIYIQKVTLDNNSTK